MKVIVINNLETSLIKNGARGEIVDIILEPDFHWTQDRAGIHVCVLSMVKLAKGRELTS